MKMIVGLGNPGKDYENTRHNIGFLFLDYFPGNNFNQEKFNGLYCKQVIDGEQVLFVKPLTYMNLSGNCVSRFVDYFKIDKEDLLIIQDDLDLDFGKIRLKYKSSSGGHNGIKSIMESLGTDEIPRLKVGISNDKTYDTKDYVLARFKKDDLEKLKELSKNINQIIMDFIHTGIDDCIKKYNTK